MKEKPGQENAGGPPESLLQALQTLLRPLVRGLISKGVTYPHLAEMLKTIFVDVAAKDFGETDAELTQSRISFLTGVHRKDVKRLRDVSPTKSAIAKAAPLGARLVGVWAGSSKYLDEDGQPLKLPYQSAKSDAVSFDSLVKSVSTDVRPRSVFDEWRRLGIVSQDSDGMISLNVHGFIPQDDFDQSAYFFGRNVRDHIAAAIHNILQAGRPFLERAVFYDRLTQRSVDRLESVARKLGEEALLEVNREALKCAEQDDGLMDATKRMTFGTYYFSADERDDASGKNDGSE